MSPIFSKCMTADASDLGWAPGHFPKSFVYDPSGDAPLTYDFVELTAMTEKKRFKSLMRMPAVETAAPAAPTPPQTPAADQRAAPVVNPTLPPTPKPSSGLGNTNAVARENYRKLYNVSDDGIHQKQWEIWTEKDGPQGYRLYTQWGRVASTLQRNFKSYFILAAMMRDYQRLVDSKMKKGYHV